MNKLFNDYNNKLVFKLSQIGYALNSDIIFTSRLINNNYDYNHCYMYLLKEAKNGDKIFITINDKTIDYNLIVEILRSRNIKLNFYIMGEPFIPKELIELFLPYSIHMFLNNNIYNHPQVHSMPIGIRDCGKVVCCHPTFFHDYLEIEKQKEVKKEYLCLLSFLVHDNIEDRINCYNLLKNKNFVININNDITCNYQNMNIKCPEFYNYAHKSFYLLNPKGCGEDTHRFYEANYLDCIPIVKRTNTTIDKLFNCFPCLIVDNWEDITEELLENKKEECFDKLEKFKLKYPNWIRDLDSIEQLLINNT